MFVSFVAFKQHRNAYNSTKTNTVTHKTRQTRKLRGRDMARDAPGGDARHRVAVQQLRAALGQATGAQYYDILYYTILHYITLCYVILH